MIAVVFCCANCDNEFHTEPVRDLAQEQVGPGPEFCTEECRDAYAERAGSSQEGWWD